tara:strand:+ start:3217 stop:3999 length:783 start_codon:yes stop_codon:yes gene_type:complete
MNKLERQMIDILKCLKNDFGAIEVKSEFEAEGSRIEEMMRLKDVTSNLDLPLILKIGGVEALTDVYNGLIIGVNTIIAPMAESKFAVKKYLDMVSNYIALDNQEDLNFFINIETKLASENFEEILSLDNISKLDGVTIGRHDLVNSMGLTSDQIETSEDLNDIVLKTLKLCKKNNLKTGIGGKITAKSIPRLKIYIKQALLDKYETRKIVFSSDGIDNAGDAINKALEFELLWLLSKKRYYSGVSKQDDERITQLNERIK